MSVHHTISSESKYVSINTLLANTLSVNARLANQMTFLVRYRYRCIVSPQTKIYMGAVIMTEQKTM